MTNAPLRDLGGATQSADAALAALTLDLLRRAGPPSPRAS
jgi:hypothetical protein